MRVSEVRQRVLGKVQEVAVSGDEEATAKIVDYARAVLVALAPIAEGEDVDLEGLGVGTATAARILSLHTEYVREMIRRGYLKAEKQDGEFRIKFPDLLEFAARRMRDRTGPPATWASVRKALGPWRVGEAVYKRPPEEPPTGEQPA